MTDPIGVRHYNPGNIRNAAAFEGGHNDPESGFGYFDSPVLGAKAQIKNLQSYYTKYGLDTVAGIANRWAPPTENNTANYAAGLAQFMGVKPDDKLNMRDPATLAQLAAGISKMEGTAAHGYTPDFYKAVVSDNPELAAYQLSQGATPFIKSQMRAAAFQQNPQAPGEPQAPITETGGQFGQTWTAPPILELEADRQSGAEAAAGLRTAGVQEAFLDSYGQNTLTAAIDRMLSANVDPNWKLTDQHIAQMNQAGILGDQNLISTVSGATSEQDFQSRLNEAKDRKDLMSRLANTQGFAGFADTLAGFVGGMADPVAILATAGLGASVNAARTMRAMTGAAKLGGMVTDIGVSAGTNVGLVAAVDQLNNRPAHFNDLLSAGVMGGVLGAIGHAVGGHAASGRAARSMDDGTEAPRPVPPTAETLKAKADPIEQALDVHAENLQEHLDTLTNDRPLEHPDLDTPLRTDMASVMPDTPAKSATEQLADTLADVARAMRAQSTADLRTAQTDALGYTPAATIHDADYQALHANGVVTELRTADDATKLGYTALPDDTKAFYDPNTQRVVVLRDRLSPEDAQHPRGLIMHEVGVHYGLEGAIGTERYQQLLGDLAKDSSPAMKAARAAVPADTPDHLKAEEMLGYLAEHAPRSTAFQRLLATIRNWLRDTVPAFNGMRVTPQDALAYIRGAVERAKRPEVRRAEPVLQPELRYSRSKTGRQPDAADKELAAATTRSVLRISKRAEEFESRVKAWDDTPLPGDEQKQARLEKFYNEQRIKTGADHVANWIDTPSLILGRSKNKAVRWANAQLFESASGLGSNRESSVAMAYERMQERYKTATIPKIKDLVIRGMTPGERAAYYMGFGVSAEDRIYRAVAEERLQRRAAIRNGTDWHSTAPQYIQDLAQVMDDFYHDAAQDGLKVGNSYAAKVWGSGTVGFMPYSWNWQDIARAASSDPAKFKALHSNLVQQYRDLLIEPGVQEALVKNPEATADELEALRQRLSDKVDTLVSNKLQQIMSDPRSRTNQEMDLMGDIASQLLQEQWAGERVTPELIAGFRQKLVDIQKDRSRTELDLLRTVDGVQLLDFLDYNALRQATFGAHRWAGLNALAAHGLRDLNDGEALKEMLRANGASPEEVEAIDFGLRSFGLGQIRNAERASFTTLKNFVYAATMGKLGLNNLGDIPSMAAEVGWGSTLRALGGSLRDAPVVKQLAKASASLVGQDYRLYSITPDVSANGRIMIGKGSTLNRIAQRAAQGVSWINGANLLGRMLHRGFLPIFIEDAIDGIRSKGGLSVERLADLGLSGDMAKRIRGQLEKYDGGRKSGDVVNWDKWDDQEAADRFIEAIHRGTDRVFQRALVGETPMWMTESEVGGLIGQFRGYGIINMEKGLARNIAIGDMQAVLALTTGVSWGACLYYARLQANTIGMSDEDRRKYFKENTTPLKLAAGILNLTNMSGMLPDGLDLGELLFGGNSWEQRGSPIAAAGYLGNVFKAGHAIGNQLTGQSTDTGADARAILRIAPGANTLIGTYIMNSTR